MVTTANDRPLRVMISSRCGSLLARKGRGHVPLSDVRLEAKSEIERLLGYGNRPSAFEVWINEPSEATPLDDTWFAESIEQARKADIVIVLFSGDAGSQINGEGDGVCHAEFVAAVADAPSKVRVIDVRDALIEQPASSPASRRFVNEVGNHGALTDRPKNDKEIAAAIVEAVTAATHRLALYGIVEARRGSKSLGAALDWRRLDFSERKAEMQSAVLDYLVSIGARATAHAGAILDLADQRLMVLVNAAPEGLSLAASRELVGQPHRRDHLLAGALGEADAIGPIHVIPVPGTATASQARSLMGSPDVMTAAFPAGMWVADRVNRAQALVIAGCADPASTGLRVGEAFEWIRTSGESADVVRRAVRRRAILEQIAMDDSAS